MVEKPPKLTIIKGGRESSERSSAELSLIPGGLTEGTVLAEKPKPVINPTEKELLVLSDYAQRLRKARAQADTIVDWVYNDLCEKPPPLLVLYRALYDYIDDPTKADWVNTYIQYIEDVYAPKT